MKLVTKTHIYVLIDPRDGSLFYVGKTNKPNERLRYGYNTEVEARLAEIVESSGKISPTVIEVVQAKGDHLQKEDWVPREKHWIKHYKNAGAVLLNRNDGGGGPTHYTPEALAKSVAPLWGRPATEKIREAARKLGISRRGSCQTEYQKSRVSEALIGRPKPPFSNEHRKNLALAHETRWSPDARKARSQSQEHVWDDPQYQKHMKEVHEGKTQSEATKSKRRETWAKKRATNAA